MNEAESPIRKEAHLSGPGLIWWSVSFPFRDPQFISTFGWGVVLLWLPFFREAFLLRTLRGALRGERHPLASWDVSRRMFGDGFLFCGAFRVAVARLVPRRHRRFRGPGGRSIGRWRGLGSAWRAFHLGRKLGELVAPLPGGDVSQDPLGRCDRSQRPPLSRFGAVYPPWAGDASPSRRRLCVPRTSSRIAGHGRTVVSVMMGLFLASLVDRGLNGIFTFDRPPFFNSVGTLGGRPLLPA